MKGIFPALLTPFDEKGRVEMEQMKNLIRHLIEVKGVPGLFIGGSAGEGFKLSGEERKDVMSCVVETIQSLGIEIMKKDFSSGKNGPGSGIFPLIAHIGSLDYREILDLGRHAEQLGYSALAAIVPFYYPLSREEIIDYFRQLGRTLKTGVLVYYFPGYTGVRFDLETFTEILNLPGIIGSKYTDKDLFMLERLVSRFPEKIFYTGFDEMLLSSLVLGLDGGIGSSYNVHGHLAIRLAQYVEEGKIKQALKLQQRINAISERTIPLGELSALKVILAQRGIDTGYAKFPMRRLTEEESTALVRVANDNLKDWEKI